MNFASENFDGVHPAILAALVKANKSFAPSYGKDAYTLKAIASLRKAFGTNDMEAFFCFNGTGANNFALSAITQKHSAILCTDIAHLYTAESTAPETFTGCRLYPVQSVNGKIIIADLLQKLKKNNGIHLPKAAVLSITQPTEYGTVYNLKELKTIARHCKANNILLHIDGARIFNAAVALRCSVSDIIKASGTAVLTLGGTKNGLMFGEAVIFFKSKRSKNLAYNHKRSMQLASKNRFIAAQFGALFKDELWKKIATHCNNLAKYFEQELNTIDKGKILYPVETNMVFVKMSTVKFDQLKKHAIFYHWDTANEEVRFAFSFSNTKKEIDDFLKEYKRS